jgi:hypothetical protein
MSTHANRGGGLIHLPPLMVNIRPSELKDSTAVGKGPHGMSTRTMYTGWTLRGQLQKIAATRWKEDFAALDIELPLDDVVRWCRLKDETDLVERLSRLCRSWGTLPRFPGDKIIKRRPPVIAAYQVLNGRVWYSITAHYLRLPNDDRMYLKLDTFEDAIGDRQKFRELTRAAAAMGRRENERATRAWYEKHRPRHYK